MTHNIENVTAAETTVADIDRRAEESGADYEVNLE